MKLFIELIAVLTQAAAVSAFANIGSPLVQFEGTRVSNRNAITHVTSSNATFDAKQQLVSVSGKHKFVPPNFAAGDVRGPCPGLNAMANHGYIPHSGVATHVEFIKGTFDVFGMGEDLSTILTLYGGIMDGNGLQWSIGGPSPQLPAPPGSQLGVPQGISASHNKYEGDGSPLRGDLYTSGNDFKLQVDQFRQLWELGQANDDVFDLDVLTEFRSNRFDHSVATNPYFFNGPFTGVLVQPAAYAFIYRFMGNKSAEIPDGLLNSRVLMEFMGVSQEKGGNFKRRHGYERIPNNWYKRHPNDSYGLNALGTDAGAMGRKYRKFMTIGGNVGKVDTLTGIDPANFTNGVYNLRSLRNGKNLVCFAMQAAALASPDLIKCSAVYQNATKEVSLLNDYIGQTLSGFDCLPLGKLDLEQLGKFPGYKNLNCRSGQY